MREPAKTREKLLETAIELVWRSNYCSVGVNEICKRAGVTKGAFYHHFESKADLFYAAAQFHWEHSKSRWDAIFSPALSPLEQLEHLIDYILNGHDEHHLFSSEAPAGAILEVTGCPFFSAGGQVGLEETRVRQAAVEMAEHSIRYSTAFVRGLKAGGYLEGDPDAGQVGRMTVLYVHGLLIYARAHNSRAIVEADLRAGLYRILDIKAEHRRESVPERHQDASPLVAAGV